MRRFTNLPIFLLAMLIGVGLLGSTLLLWTPERPSAAQSLEARGGAMSSGGLAMIGAADTLGSAAEQIETQARDVDYPDLAALATEWQIEAAQLRAQGIEMTASLSAESMVHDPATAPEFDPASLRGNGSVMVAEGQKMVDLGGELNEQIAILSDVGILPPGMVMQLSSSASALINAGEHLVQEGQDMQEYADQLLRSIGR